MAEAFTGREVLQMAMDMEQTGQAFYRALAAGCDNVPVAKLCLRLAGMEAAHHARFKKMLDRIFRPGVDLPFSEVQLEKAHDLVTSRIQPKPDQVTAVAMGGNVKDALAMALRMEKESIMFYSEMLRFMPDDDRAIPQIIAEEKSHIDDLQALPL